MVQNTPASRISVRPSLLLPGSNKLKQEMEHQTMSAIVVFLLPLLATGRTNPLIDYIEESNNQFAFDFYQAIRNNTGNVFASTISLKMSLALMQLGAEGDTAAEMSNVLRHPRDNLKTFDAYRSLINELKNPALKIANKVFVDNSCKIIPRFMIGAIRYFLSTTQEVNFLRDPEGARNIINAWVESNTNNKIKNFFNPGSISPNTRLALVNAIHFKAQWMHQFKEEDTKDALFHIAPTQTVEVKMMLLKRTLFYKDSAMIGAEILELPFKVQDFSMVLILPHVDDGLAKVESKMIFPDLLTTELRTLSPSRAEVQMPRFKLEKQMNLEEILKNLGMLKAFSNLAEFTKMSNEPVKIDKVVQKAFIEVNEKGAEASAATGVSYDLKSIFPVQKIRFDRPFIFLVMKNSTILFIGRLSNPE